MISRHFVDGLPKYIWAVDSDGNAYEARISGSSGKYHGYELNDDDRSMRDLVKKERNSRCPLV